MATESVCTVSRRPARYRVTATIRGCELWLADGYHNDPLVDGPVTLSFWAPNESGHVYQETPDRPGTSGGQVCETLFGMGSTLCASRGSLPDVIRRMARRHCDAVDRESIWRTE